jgi:hypothetical protein
MKWPYDKRLEAAHAWGVVAVGTAGIVGLPTVLATSDAPYHYFRWWWPTNWMLVPVIVFVIGLLLTGVPVRRRKDEVDVVESQAIRPMPNVTGEIAVSHVAGDAAAIRGRRARSGQISGKAKAQRLEEGAKLSGIDIDRIG